MFLMSRPPPNSTLFPYTTLFRSQLTPQTYWQTNHPDVGKAVFQIGGGEAQSIFGLPLLNNYYTVFDRSADKNGDRKSTRLNSSHRCISYAVFCLKKKRRRA